MHYQPIYDIAELCVRKGIHEVILCPGSRCAPLTLAFTRNKGIKPRTFSDERSAAFIALGIAQRLKQPVVLVCTSGSAVYNFAPAVAEAFFSHTPLVVFSADRPSEWIAQHDGQTIFQNDIFGKHVKAFYQLPQDYEHADNVWAINRMVNEAINLSMQEPRGPVHINAPFREPLYPAKNEDISFSADVRVVQDHFSGAQLNDNDKAFITQQWTLFRKGMVVAGQNEDDPALAENIFRFSETYSFPVVGDIISNIPGKELVAHSDLFLGQASEGLKKTLQPDLLITFGKSLISKNLKAFLRKHSPKKHWHIQPAGTAADTFRNVTNVFYTTPENFFSFLGSLPLPGNFEKQQQQNFRNLWEVEERRARRCIQEFFPQEDLCELEVVKTVLDHIPDDANLHLANSMSVRYANFIGLTSKQPPRVYANRGTSGIDGCTSTAVGHALASGGLHILITGDVAFFYDRNAFWHNYDVPNLRILLLNNHGGLIFNMIDGPASQPEAAEYFITRQPLDATKLCEEFNFEHLKLDNKRKLKNLIKSFFEDDGRTKVLEVQTDLQLNRQVFDNLKQKIKNSYEI
jgi:2-succinyl-5-enolpyruvyl-6-hydroxy-3-cyclohexene-1-carboxylate synthase